MGTRTSDTKWNYWVQKKVKQYFDELRSQDADWYYPNKTGEHKGTTIVPKWLWPLVDMVKFVQLLYPY